MGRPRAPRWRASRRPNSHRRLRAPNSRPTAPARDPIDKIALARRSFPNEAEFPRRHAVQSQTSAFRSSGRWLTARLSSFVDESIRNGSDQEPSNRKSRRNRHSSDARRSRIGPADRCRPFARGSLLAASDEGRRELPGRGRKGTDRGLSRHRGHHSHRHGSPRRCHSSGLRFLVREPGIRRSLRGNKVEARNLAAAAGVPVMPATPPLPADDAQVVAMARAVGFPVMLKASWGGGGRGMRIVESDRDLIETVAEARREAKAAFGKDEVYLEKLIRRARHVEVQILGDAHGNLVHLYERDCSVQRRKQKE